MKRLMILLVALLVTSVSFGENGPSPLITPSSVSGLGTIATVDSPVPVANGGTGATTAATGLAALGGASLNGSSTVAFSASTLNGVAPLTAAEKTQALVGSTTVDHTARVYTNTANVGTSIAFQNLLSQAVENDASATLSLSGRLSATIIIHNGNTNKGGLFFFNTTPAEIADPNSAYSTTEDAAGSTNLYVSGGALKIQNKTGSAVSYRILMEGIKP